KVPASSRSQVSPADALKIGAQLSALSAYSMSKEPASTGPFRSSGRVVFRLMVPPSAPSTISGVGDLITSTEERKLAGKSSKLMPFRPPPTVERPFTSTRFCGRPRIETSEPTPKSRLMEIPVTRWSASRSEEHTSELQSRENLV